MSAADSEAAVDRLAAIRQDLGAEDFGAYAFLVLACSLTKRPRSCSSCSTALSLGEIVTLGEAVLIDEHGVAIGFDHTAVEQIVAQHVTAALTEAADAIEAKRSIHWQQHLRDHPYADHNSCPGDYGKHDAYMRAAAIVRDLAAP